MRLLTGPGDEEVEGCPCALDKLAWELGAFGAYQGRCDDTMRGAVPERPEVGAHKVSAQESGRTQSERTQK